MKKVIFILTFLLLFGLTSCVDQEDRFVENIYEEAQSRTSEENILRIYEVFDLLLFAVENEDYAEGKDHAIEIETILSFLTPSTYVTEERQDKAWGYERNYKQVTLNDAKSYTEQMVYQLNTLINLPDFESATYKALEIMVYCDRLQEDAEE